MGYRSNVGLCLSKNGVSLLKQKLGKLDWKTMSDVKDLLNYPDAHFIDVDTGCELWYWTWLKWYVDYPDVSFIENTLLDMDTEDFLFIRIGDDSDDNDIQGDFWENPFDMGFSRSIEFEKSGV